MISISKFQLMQSVYLITRTNVDIILLKSFQDRRGIEIIRESDLK